MITKKFIGTLSGDGECFCWEVDKGTFENIVGRKSDTFDYKKVDWKDINNPKPIGDILALYPDHIFYHEKGKYEIEIKFRKID